MKLFVIIVLMLISKNYVAQENTQTTNVILSEQKKEWMADIAANPELRLEMIQMMIDQTTDKPKEMQLLIDRIMSNPQMKNMLGRVSYRDSMNNNSINQPSMINKYKDIMKKTNIEQKPVIKN